MLVDRRQDVARVHHYDLFWVGFERLSTFDAQAGLEAGFELESAEVEEKLVASAFCAVASFCADPLFVVISTQKIICIFQQRILLPLDGNSVKDINAIFPFKQVFG